jgi:hypothetical protein
VKQGEKQVQEQEQDGEKLLVCGFHQIPAAAKAMIGKEESRR